MTNENLRKSIRALLKLETDDFINTDIGAFSGVICIRTDFEKFDRIFSNLAEIDLMLSNTLEGDILSGNISYSFNGENEKLEITYHFVYD